MSSSQRDMIGHSVIDDVKTNILCLKSIDLIISIVDVSHLITEDQMLKSVGSYGSQQLILHHYHHHRLTIKYK